MPNFLNTYVPPVVDKAGATPPHATTPLEEYDLNFVFPLKTLESEKVIVTPFIPSLHAQAYVDGTNEDPGEMFKYLPWGPFTLDSFLVYLEAYRREPTKVLFAVIDKAANAFAGVLDYHLAEADNLVLELGHVIVMRPFRRTYVLTHAIGLLLEYAFSPKPKGLNMRRIQWTASAKPLNTSSVKAAHRMGFKEEGVLRWREVSSTSFGEPKGSEQPGLSLWVSSVTWEDWEGGVRELCSTQMRRDQ